MFYHNSSPNAARVRCYADALVVLERAKLTPKRKQLKRRTPQGGWLVGSKVMQVIPCKDGAIAFRLYNTDVVTWYPDNSFYLATWPSAMTASFAYCFTPDEVRLCADTTVSFTPADAPPHGHWKERWRAMRKCRGDVVFRNGENGWAPDEAMLEPLRFLELDRKHAREVAKDYHLRDFKLWLEVAPYHLKLEHERENMRTVRDALWERDFKTAALHLPLIADKSNFGNELKPLPITTYSSSKVTMSSLSWFRNWLYEEAGAFERTAFTIMALPDFINRMKRLKDLSRAGVSTYGFGV